MRLGICDMEASFVPRTGNQIGVPDELWRTRSRNDRLAYVLDIIGNSGFEFVELGVPWINDGPSALPVRDIAAMLRQYALSVGAYNSFVPPDMPIVGENVDWTRVRRYLELTLENCAILGGPIVVLGSGESRNVTQGYSEADAQTDLLKFVDLWLDIVIKQNFDLTLALEALNRDECNFINSIAAANSLVKRYDHPRFRLIVDCYHLCKQESNYWKELEDAIANVCHIQIVEPTSRRRPGFQERHEFDYQRLVNLIQEHEYNGSLSVEAIFKNLEQEINLCFGFLRELVK